MIFVAGLSGSGKTVAADRSGVRPVVPLDSYYHDDHVVLPKWLGRSDWEAIGAYDLDNATSAVLALARGVDVDVPVYDHHVNAKIAVQTTRAVGPFVAEGVYAPDVYERVVAAGIAAALVLIDVPARTAFAARIRRDVGDRRMSPVWALVRSSRLVLRHASYRSAVVALGADARSRKVAPARISALAVADATQERG